MIGKHLLALPLVLFVCALSASSAVADQPTGLPPQMNVWHRLNNDQRNPAPEHERLSCNRGLAWSCHYDKGS
jgi:hypothetical protein